MTLALTFLGTSAARPTVERNVSAIALKRAGETLLFDCGEGTQRQMMRYGVGFTLADIFFTHFHADHFLGLTGLVRTLALQGRTEPMTLWGPRGAERLLRQALELGHERATFDIAVREVQPGERVTRHGYDLETVPGDHASHALGWVLREHERLGRFDPERARALGIPEGPLWGRLHRGEAVTVAGRTIAPHELVGAPRPGRIVVLSGDTRPNEALVRATAGADLLVHEATFSQEDHARAVETRHSTAREAAQVALAAGVRRLVLTHVSARFSADSAVLQAEAREVFPATVVARDGMVVAVGFDDEGEGGG